MLSVRGSGMNLIPGRAGALRSPVGCGSSSPFGLPAFGKREGEPAHEPSTSRPQANLARSWPRSGAGVSDEQ